MHHRPTRFAATKGPTPALSLTLSGVVDRRFFRRAARSLERLLARTPTTVTLRIEALREVEGPHLERLLLRLRRYGDRVSIVVDERLRQIVRIDSSVFKLAYQGRPPGFAGEAVEV